MSEPTKLTETTEPWPTCPGCGQRRMTVCPYCKSAGQKFPVADLEYSVDDPDGLGVSGEASWMRIAS